MDAPAHLRAWQVVALEQLDRHDRDDFLLVACPGAGKTRWSLTAARRELDRGRIDQVVVVVPSEPLKYQWAAAATRLRIDLKPDWRNSDGVIPDDFHGVVITYAQLAQGADLMRMHVARQRTLVVLDEVHHLAEGALWGSRALTAFEPAVLRISASGTPFRSDGQTIPFVQYAADGTSRADYSYGYGQAVRDHVCRPVFFPQYDGTLEWHNGRDVVAATFDDDLDTQGQSHRLRTALAPDAQFVRTLLVDANSQLQQLRNGDHENDRPADPEATGLVLAMDQQHAAALANLLEDITGEPPVVAVSDDADARDKIARFNGLDTPWLVAVRMVSEGTDIPSLRVLVYATNYVAPLFFRQAVGRVVRVRHDSPVPVDAQDAFTYLPNDERLRQLARDVYLETLLPREPTRDESASRELNDEDRMPTLFTPVRAVGQLAGVTHEGDPITAAELAHAAQLGGQVGFRDVRDITRVARVLRLVGSAPTSTKSTSGDTLEETPKHERVAALRKLNTRVANRVAFLAGLKFADVNRQLNEGVGVASVSEATEERLQTRVQLAQQWEARVERYGETA